MYGNTFMIFGTDMLQNGTQIAVVRNSWRS